MGGPLVVQELPRGGRLKSRPLPFLLLPFPKRFGVVRRADIVGPLSPDRQTIYPSRGPLPKVLSPFKLTTPKPPSGVEPESKNPVAPSWTPRQQHTNFGSLAKPSNNLDFRTSALIQPNKTPRFQPRRVWEPNSRPPENTSQFPASPSPGQP